MTSLRTISTTMDALRHEIRKLENRIELLEKRHNHLSDMQARMLQCEICESHDVNHFDDLDNVGVWWCEHCGAVGYYDDGDVGYYNDSNVVYLTKNHQTSYDHLSNRQIQLIERLFEKRANTLKD